MFAGPGPFFSQWWRNQLNRQLYQATTAAAQLVLAVLVRGHLPKYSKILFANLFAYWGDLFDKVNKNAADFLRTVSRPSNEDDQFDYY
jgi:hypothetical protein